MTGFLALLTGAPGHATMAATTIKIDIWTGCFSLNFGGLNGEGFSIESNCCRVVTFNCRQSFNQSSPVWTLNLLSLSTFQRLWWFQSIVAKLTFFTLSFTFFLQIRSLQSWLKFTRHQTKTSQRRTTLVVNLPFHPDLGKKENKIIPVFFLKSSSSNWEFDTGKCWRLSELTTMTRKIICYEILSA